MSNNLSSITFVFKSYKLCWEDVSSYKDHDVFSSADWPICVNLVLKFFASVKVDKILSIF